MILGWSVAALVGAVAVWRQGGDLLLGPERAWACALTLLAHLAVVAPFALWIRRAWLSAALGLVGMLLALGWASLLRQERPHRVGAASGPDIVLVTLDTFRADNLGVLGGAGTPDLDALAGRGALYTQCVTTAPLTAPAHASMLTGLSPAEHGLLANGGRTTAATVTPELLAAGYRTGAFLSSRVLDRRGGLNQGFEHYEDRWSWPDQAMLLLGWEGLGWGEHQRRDGSRTVQRALAWLKEQEGAAFVWVHLYDAHSPYVPPAGFGPSDAAKAAARAADHASRPATQSIRAFVGSFESGVAQMTKLMYRGAASYEDHVVGELITGLPSDAIVIVVGDHGESLGEHGYYFNHGANLLEPSLHVPLIVVWPGSVAPGARVDGLVGVEQVADTLRRAAGLAPRGPDLLDAARGRGLSEVPSLTSGQESHRPLGQDDRSTPSAALRLDGAKLVVGESSAVWYDLRQDPDELSPAEPPPELSARVSTLRAQLAAAGSARDAVSAVWLKAIGYTE